MIRDADDLAERRHVDTSDPAASCAEIRVKVRSQIPAEHWLHQFPGGEPTWGRCRFLFDPDTRDYDWLVIYDDVPRRPGEHRKQASEVLACPASHTLLVTSEPSSIKFYGNDFTRQFGCVLTSQAAWALPHGDRIHAQPALQWFYGIGREHVLDFAAIEALDAAGKTRDLSMVFSPKSMRHTLHRRRHDFMRLMMQRLPEMDVYGRGARPLDDKAEALEAYRYHIAVENYIGPHHWTEKLADAFLGLTLPFYCGCPNLTDYFPAQSYIAIDIRDPQAALRTIRRAIADNEYEKRLPYIREAKRRVLHQHNFFAVLAREIERRPDGGGDTGRTLYSRHALRARSLRVKLGDLYGKARALIITQTVDAWRQ